MYSIKDSQVKVAAIFMNLKETGFKATNVRVTFAIRTSFYIIISRIQIKNCYKKFI